MTRGDLPRRPGVRPGLGTRAHAIVHPWASGRVYPSFYVLSPAPRSLLTLSGAEHSLGGIPGYTVTETTDGSPERVALIQQLTWAFLRSTLYPADTSWSAASTEPAQSTDPLGQIESK